MQVLTGGDGKTKKINLKESIHPSISYALKIIKDEFKDLCIKGQDILGNQELWQKVLVLIPDQNIRTKLHSDFATLKDSEERWSRYEIFKNSNFWSKTDKLKLFPKYISVSLHISTFTSVRPASRNVMSQT